MKYTICYYRSFLSFRLLFVLFILFPKNVVTHAQVAGNQLQTESLLKKQTVTTPTMAALIQNIAYPVNYSTGLPEIKIPLYDIKCGDYTLPIYLSYHASGVKLSDVSGWVGQGWQLTAEPMLSRTIKGKLDDPKTMICQFDKNAFMDINYRHALAVGISDEQPDEYYYRLPDKQGLFMYVLEPKDATSKFMSLPYENVRIDKAGKSFYITNDDGVLYKFDGGIERSGSELDIVGWKASSIIFSNTKDSISFVYNTQNSAYQVKTHNDYMVVIDNFSRSTYHWTNRFDESVIKDSPVPDEFMQDPIVYSTVCNKTKTYQYNKNGNLVSDWFDYYISNSSPTIQTWSEQISEIRFGGGKVVFAQSKDRKRLEKIIVYNTIGDIIREIQFTYKDVLAQERFYLDRISVMNRHSVAQETYRFNYYSPELLRKPGDRSIDYWGYFNGISRSDTTTLVPFQTIEASKDSISISGIYYPTIVNFSIGSRLSRESDEKYMVYGTLKSIIYPAGASDEFIYEANRHETTEGIIRKVGGLRIKQIKSSNKGRIEKIRTFTYGIGDNGIGYSQATESLEYFTLQQTQYYGDPLTIWFSLGGMVIEPDWDKYVSARYRAFFSNPVTPITYEGGSTVMSDYVTEYNGTPESNSGKTVYEYSINKTRKIPNLISTIQGNRHLDWQYGHLTKKTIYRNDSGQYKAMECVENTYSTNDKNFGKIYVGEAFKTNVIRPCISNLEYDCSFLRTTIDVGAKLLKRTIHRIYDNEGRETNISTSYNYDIPGQIFPTQQIEEGKDNLQYVTTYTYPINYGSTSPYLDMVKKNIVSPVIKTKYVRGNKYLETETPYTPIYSSSDIYRPDKLNVRYSPSGNWNKRFSYKYDERGKINEEIKDEKETTVCLYGYNGQYIIARIENATYADVVAKISGGESTVRSVASTSCPSADQWSSIQNLRNSLPQARITTYAYNPLVGVSAIIDPARLMTCYDYDDLGRLVKTYLVNNNRSEFLERYDYHYKN